MASMDGGRMSFGIWKNTSIRMKLTELDTSTPNVYNDYFIIPSMINKK